MPARNRFPLLSVVVAGVVLITTTAVSAKGIEKAVRGKQYKLTKRHGPWMIMVASFHEPPPERLDKEGLTPEEAADELVFELRKNGIPAYTYSQNDVVGELDTFDRLGRERRRQYVARQKSVCVIAGNYKSSGDKVAQKTLKFVKKFEPEYLGGVEKQGRFLRKLKNGGIYRKTPGRPGPLSGAFLTINPLIPPEEARHRRHDPLMLALNSDSEYSLIDNPAKYTLVVASFYGKSQKTHLANQSGRLAKGGFDVTNSLDVAAKSAWGLARALRTATTLGYDEDHEAYVFHERYRSVVTVGAFDSPNDPEIVKLQKLFGAKTPSQERFAAPNVLSAEIFTIPRNALPGQALKSWIFDPYPALIPVPRL